MPKRFKESLKEMGELMEGHGNYSKYRAALNNARPPMLPYLGVCLRDLTFIEDGNDTMVDGLLNFDKMRLIRYVLRRLPRVLCVRACAVCCVMRLRSDCHTLLLSNKPSAVWSSTFSRCKWRRTRSNP